MDITPREQALITLMSAVLRREDAHSRRERVYRMPRTDQDLTLADSDYREAVIGVGQAFSAIAALEEGTAVWAAAMDAVYGEDWKHQ